jgi:hypothetical protein
MSNLLDSFESQIDYFVSKVVKRGAPASEQMIHAAEEKLGFQLSPQHKAFLRRYNGLFIVEATLLGVPALNPRKKLGFTNLVKEHISLRDGPLDWPSDWLSLGADGFGNYYVASLHRADEQAEYPILFVEHDTLDVENSVFASGYFDFLAKLINQMHSLYLPDGRLKD